jgi:hypothetical protein
MGISKLPEDFQGYANLWFSHAHEALTKYRYKQGLRDETIR